MVKDQEALREGWGQEADLFKPSVAPVAYKAEILSAAEFAEEFVSREFEAFGVEITRIGAEAYQLGISALAWSIAPTGTVDNMRDTLTGLVLEHANAFPKTHNRLRITGKRFAGMDPADLTGFEKAAQRIYNFHRGYTHVSPVTPKRFAQEKNATHIRKQGRK